jgi:deoxycytidine triphosphate deaminase
MSVLTHESIKEYILRDQLIENYSDDSIEGASYDLKLGKKYIKNGITIEITPPSAGIKLEPGEFALLTSFEKINMPLNLVGHNGLMSKWARQGLVSLFSPQIDPGFKGFLFVPVYNAGDADISIPLEDKIFTLEFIKTDKEAKFGWSEPTHHGTQDNISTYSNVPKMSKPIFADIDKLDHKIDMLENNLANLKDKVNSKVTNTSIILAAVAIVISIIPTFKSLVNNDSDTINTHQEELIKNSKDKNGTK